MSSRGIRTQEASKQVFVDALPPVLLLHLKRFLYDEVGGVQKSTKKVAYGTELSIDERVMSAPLRAQVGKDGARYELFGGESIAIGPRLCATGSLTFTARHSRLPPRAVRIGRPLHCRRAKRIPFLFMARTGRHAHAAPHRRRGGGLDFGHQPPVGEHRRRTAEVRRGRRRPEASLPVVVHPVVLMERTQVGTGSGEREGGRKARRSPAVVSRSVACSHTQAPHLVRTSLTHNRTRSHAIKKKKKKSHPVAT